MFTFKRFSVDDSHSAMKVGTDGVVLGAWASVDGAVDIADIGCGSGLIALMLAQRAENACVTGIEIDPPSAADAAVNFRRSPWSDRISLICGDVFTSGLNEGSFDLIVCNPPFFVEDLKSPDVSRASARHEGSLGVASLIGLASRLLRREGKLAFVAPSSRDSDIALELACARMSLRRRMHLRQRHTRKPVRTFYEVGFGDCTCSDSELVISSPDGGYTSGFCALTRDFYLNVD